MSYTSFENVPLVAGSTRAATTIARALSGESRLEFVIDGDSNETQSAAGGISLACRNLALLPYQAARGGLWSSGWIMVSPSSGTQWTARCPVLAGTSGIYSLYNFGNGYGVASGTQPYNTWKASGTNEAKLFAALPAGWMEKAGASGTYSPMVADNTNNSVMFMLQSMGDNFPPEIGMAVGPGARWWNTDEDDTYIDIAFLRSSLTGWCDEAIVRLTGTDLLYGLNTPNATTNFTSGLGTDAAMTLTGTVASGSMLDASDQPSVVIQRFGPLPFGANKGVQINVNAAKMTFLGATSGGTFTVGETVTQAGSLATGVVVAADATSLTVWWKTKKFSGTSGNITGATATLTPSAVVTNGGNKDINVGPITVASTFTNGETVTQATSGAQGTVVSTTITPTGITLKVTVTSGTFNSANEITGGTSGAKATPTFLIRSFVNVIGARFVRPSVNGISISPFSAQGGYSMDDHLTGHSTATVAHAALRSVDSDIVPAIWVALGINDSYVDALTAAEYADALLDFITSRRTLLGDSTALAVISVPPYHDNEDVTPDEQDAEYDLYADAAYQLVMSGAAGNAIMLNTRLFTDSWGCNRANENIESLASAPDMLAGALQANLFENWDGSTTFTADDLINAGPAPIPIRVKQASGTLTHPLSTSSPGATKYYGGIRNWHSVGTNGVADGSHFSPNGMKHLRQAEMSLLLMAVATLGESHVVRRQNVRLANGQIVATRIR